MHSMVITMCQLSGYGIVRHLDVSLPYVAALLVEHPNKYRLPVEVAPPPIEPWRRRVRFQRNQLRGRKLAAMAESQGIAPRGPGRPRLSAEDRRMLDRLLDPVE